ncbi:MAG: hypothetical protein WEE89_16515 [Gemmatimonadota bacterium]
MKQTRLDVLKQGLVCGSLGYLAVSLYYAVVNVVAGRSPFDTVAAIGQAMFQPANATAAIIAYNGVHLVILLLLGLLAAWLVYRVELQPAVWHAVLFALIALFLFASSAVAFVAGRYAQVGPAIILPGNLLAALAIGGYLGWSHPGLEHRIELLSDTETMEVPA